MKRLVALAAAVVVNASVLGALEWNVHVTGTPQGYVSVSEIPAVQEATVYAQAANTP